MSRQDLSRRRTQSTAPIAQLLLALWLALGAAPAHAADDPAALAAAGIERYAAAQSAGTRAERIAEFTRAADLFDAAVEAGAASAELYSNAGTAALQAGALGRAVLSFRRALAAQPRQARAAANLRAARAALPAWVPKPSGEGGFDSAFFWHRTTSSAERRAMLAGMALLAALAVGAALARRSPLAGWLAAVPCLAWFALAGSLLADRLDERRPAVVSIETTARAADSRNAPTRFAQPLPAGTEIEVLEHRGGWTRVRFANGRDGWLRTSAVVPIEPAA